MHVNSWTENNHYFITRPLWPKITWIENKSVQLVKLLPDLYVDSARDCHFVGYQWKVFQNNELIYILGYQKSVCFQFKHVWKSFLEFPGSYSSPTVWGFVWETCSCMLFAWIQADDRWTEWLFVDAKGCNWEDPWGYNFLDMFTSSGLKADRSE